MIEFKNVTKRYGDKLAVDNVSFRINEGEIFVLIGPSGSGKTTTLKMINRLIPLSEGYIYFKEEPISNYEVYEMRRDMGYVLQQIALFPHMTISENIAQVPQMENWSDKDINKRVDELLEMVALDPETYKDRKPSELSGGQQQRIGVLRALAADPPVILMDEPFSALDPITRENFQNDLLELQNKINKTIVFVTHDIAEAMKLADRLCLFNEGQVEQIGLPEEFIESPASSFVEQFIGKVNQDLNLTAGELVAELSVAETESEYPVVKEQADITEIFKLLSNNEAVLVETEGGSKKLSRSQVFGYLADKRGVTS